MIARLRRSGNMNSTTGLATRCDDRLTELWKLVLFLMVFGIESIVIFVVNAFALLVFHKRTFLIKRSTYLLINLTIADFLVGISAFLFMPANIIDSQYLTSFHTLAVPIPLFGSLFFMTAIALERVYATFKPLRHRFLSKKKYLAVITFIWCLVGVISAFIFVAFGMRVWKKSASNYMDKAKVIVKTISVISSGISLAIISISYLSLWIKIRFFKDLNFQNLRTIKENNKLAKTLFIITVISILTWLPILISVSLSKGSYCGDEKITKRASYAILFLNSIINFVVYLIRMPEFKNELVRMLRGKCCSRDTNHSRRNRPVRRNQVEDTL